MSLEDILYIILSQKMKIGKKYFLSHFVTYTWYHLA